MLKKYIPVVLSFYLFISGNIYAQNTYIPDDNFEQAIIDLGYDDVLDDYVVTSNISGITDLDLTDKTISDLTGIEGFVNLVTLDCTDNQLTSLDVSNNTKLVSLILLDNKLTSINLNGASSLEVLNCEDNQLTSLDVSNNTALTSLNCSKNFLTSLNVKNGSNSLITEFNATANIYLTCIQVDNATDANAGIAPYDTWQKDAIATYSEDCHSTAGIDDELLSEGLNIYPNPVSNTLSIVSKLQLTKVEIYTILGQKVKEVSSNFRSISTTNLSKGVYMVKIYSEKGTTVRGMIKK
ncbi:MAG: T9SS type A sorting domain-containing protein [Bacteroidota bacterium]